ncbi:MAG: magnesium transporter CorA family protein [Ignavibacteria bacterium]
MLQKYNFLNGALTESKEENCRVWVYVNPDNEENETIAREYNIDKHTVESATDPDEISRIEFEDDNIFIIWKRPKNYLSSDNLLFGVSSIGLFLFKERLVVVLPEDVSLFDQKQLGFTSLMDIIIKFLYNSIRHYLDHIKAMKIISREIQVKLNASMENEYLIQMFNLSESLIYYINAISSNLTVLIKLRNYFEKHPDNDERVEQMEDIIIENNQCLKQAEIYSLVLSGLMDARGNIINNNMNVLIKNLTMINIIFLPLNLLAGIGGMSEYSMMTNFVDWRISYGIFIGAMGILGWITLKFINRINEMSGQSKKIKQSLFSKLKMRKQNMNGTGY